MPSFRCELHVGGLTPGEKYVCAVAAYTAEGKLIGDAIGDSTKAILASHPMPVLMTWAYLSQVGAYAKVPIPGFQFCGWLLALV